MRIYKASRRNGQNWVDQLRPDEGGGVYGTSLILPSFNAAELVASQLNEAYAAGVREGSIITATNMTFNEITQEQKEKG